MLNEIPPCGSNELPPEQKFYGEGRKRNWWDRYFSACFIADTLKSLSSNSRRSADSLKYLDVNDKTETIVEGC